MSEMWLTLRSRIREVQRWVYIDSDTLEEARNRLDLSYESIAKGLPVVGKTVERWIKEGRVPRDVLPQFAEILGLRIETDDPEPTSVRVSAEAADVGAAERLERIESELRDLRLLLEALAVDVRRIGAAAP